MSIQNQLRTPPEDKYFGIYGATVVAILDPENLNKVRVRVWGIHDSSSYAEFLPWAIFNDPSFGGDTNVGSSVTPGKGASVSVMFLGGDVNQPVVMGGFKGKESEILGDVSAVAEDKRAYVTAVKTCAGNTIVVNDDPDNSYVRFYDSKENYVNIDLQSDPIKLSIKLKGDVAMDVDGNISITATKNIGIHAGQEIVVKSTGKTTLKSEAEMHISSKDKMSIGADDALQMTGTNSSSLDGGRVDIGSGKFSEVSSGTHTEAADAVEMFVNGDCNKYE